MADKFTLAFTMGNAAFDGPGRPDEVVRILKTIIEQIESDSEGEAIYDLNGNAVGKWSGDVLPPKMKRRR